MTTLEAYYRLGDLPGSNSVQDSSGNGYTGSLINGLTGLPTFGATGVMLYDTDGALTIPTSGGFSTIDNSTSPPTDYQPLGTASTWSVEMWFKWTGSSDATPAPAFIPPAFNGTIAHASGFAEGGYYSPLPNDSVTLSNAYATVGDLAIVGVTVVSSTITVTSINGNSSGSWTLQVRNQDAVNELCVDVWTAPVTLAGTPDILTFSYSADATSTPGYVWIDSLTAGEGDATIWTYPDIAVNQSNTNTTTLTYPSLNADGTGNTQAYWAVGTSGGTVSAVSTAGFASAQSDGGQIIANPDIFPGDNPYQPTSPTASGINTSAAIVIEASIATAASVAAIPNASLMYVATPAFGSLYTAYELQIGFAEVTGGMAGTNSSITNAVVEAFAGESAFNVYQYASNPFDGSWHHLVRISNFNSYPYLDGQQPLYAQLSQNLSATPQNLTFGTAPGGIGLNPNEGSSTLNTNAQPLTGVLDEVALYSGTLTTTQIVDHYDTALWFQQEELGAVAGNASASRLGKVLAVASLDPSVFLQVPYAFQTQLYPETNLVTTTSALNYVQTTSQSEPGIIFQSPTGYIQAYSREYQYLNETSTTSQALISDDLTSPYFYEGPSLQISGDDLDLWNHAQVQSGSTTGVLQNWGPAQSTALAQSATTFGPRTLQGLTSLQMANDSDALAIAQWLAAIYHLPIERVTQMVLDSQGNSGANIPLMLGLGLFDRISISYQGQTPGPPFTQDSIVEQISHTVVMNVPQWTTTLSMSPYEILLDAFYADSSTTDGVAVVVL